MARVESVFLNNHKGLRDPHPAFWCAAMAAWGRDVLAHGRLCPMPLEVREATDSDLPALAALRRQWHVERGRAAVGDHAEFDADFVRWCREHRSVHLAVVACDAAAVVGMGFLVLVDRVPKPGALDRRHGDIQSMYVVPAQRDSGVGSQILRALTELARDAGCIRVEVHSGSRAVPFYERSGFEHVPQLMRHPLE